MALAATDAGLVVPDQSPRDPAKLGQELWILAAIGPEAEPLLAVWP